MDSFISDEEDFESDAMFYRQPVEVVRRGDDGMDLETL